MASVSMKTTETYLEGSSETPSGCFGGEAIAVVTQDNVESFTATQVASDSTARRRKKIWETL